MPARLRAASLLTTALLFALPAAARAQTRSRQWLDDCRRGWDGDEQRACDERTSTMGAISRLEIDGRENGGVSVHGWDGAGVKVVAMIETHARTADDAQAMLKEITVATDDGRIRADGPHTEGRAFWSVSYEVWVPRATDLQIEARNGGISIDGTTGRTDAETLNGGIHLSSVSGDVTGRTTNGAVEADLSGSTWNGHGLDLRTTNGAVRLEVPSDYSANLETGTVNGGFDIDFPITVQGRLSRDLSTRLGNGGPTIRAMTTNGAVSIRRK